MRRNNRPLIPVAVMFIVVAAGLSVVMWPHVSTAAKIAFFCTGYGSGAATGGYLALRRKARAA